MREVLSVHPATPVNMGGLVVKQPLPQGEVDAIDPFLLLHHLGPISFPGGQRQQDAGVPPHPHRGFEPVTFIYKGGVHHRDSRGNDSVIYEGGVQWMTAGMGIVHSERPPREVAEQGGEQEIIQLWINLPANDKMIQPRYQSLSAESTPTLQADDGRVDIQVVAGTMDNLTGPIETRSPILALNARFEASGSLRFAIPDGYQGFIYLLDGRCRLNEADELPGGHLARLGPSGELPIEALEPTRMLLMAGAPLNEPVVASGPFVMNTHTEILQSMRDYQMGKMGILIEEF